MFCQVLQETILYCYSKWEKYKISQYTRLYSTILVNTFSVLKKILNYPPPVIC